MNVELLFNLIVVGGIAGFAAYCGSYAFHVWQARNTSSGATGCGPNRFRLPLALTAVGVALVLAAYLVRYATDRQGVLAADGIFTLRMPEKLEVKTLLTSDEVEAGEVLARFHAPEREAQLATLELKQEALAAEKRIAARQPLPLDTELVRRHQDLITERRHLEASRDQLVPAKDGVERERLREGATKRERLKMLGADVDRAGNELVQASAKRELVRAQMARITKMAASQSATGDELEVKQSELKVLDEEVRKLTTQIAHTRGQTEQVKEDLAQVQGLTADQAVVLNRDIERLRKRLAEMPAEEGPLAKQLGEELASAEARRGARLDQLDIELEQCRAELAGVRGTLAVTAPFRGRIAFREQAPQNAAKDAPVLILAPADAFRLRLRIPAAEVESLRRAGTVVLELENPGVERRFEGRLLASRPLTHDGGYVMAELVCTPPAEAVRNLGNMEPVAVKLQWVPPLYTAPFFWWGMAFAGAGLLALVPALSRRRSDVSQQETAAAAHTRSPTSHGDPMQAIAATIDLSPDNAPLVETSQAHNPAGVKSAASSLDAGAVGPVLRLLGLQLREAVIRGTVDLSILGAAEWSLDRHHARAVKTLGQALGDDEDLIRRIAAIDIDKIASPPEPLERLLRVLRAVGGPRMRHCIRTLEHRTRDHGAHSSAAVAKPGAATNSGADTNAHRNVSSNGNGHPGHPAKPLTVSTAEGT